MTEGPQRILGRVTGERSGPTLIAMAGIHGNEPAGLQAVSRVVSRLQREGCCARGRFTAIAGNLAALRENSRFVDADLNRRWTPEIVGRLLAGPATDRHVAEDGEQRLLLGVLQEEVDASEGRLYFLDLHTSSADGPPFLTVGDTLYNRRFARGFPLPLILGLEEQVDGALLEYLNNLGFTTLGIEAGRHDRESSVDHIEAVLWIALCTAGLVEAARLPDFERLRQTLLEAGRPVPRIVEVRRRHAITGSESFRMEEGFGNFHPVREGQLLARDEHGPILAPERGRILLPLYQGKGNDGFFIAREVRGFWLGVSAMLRRLRLGRLLRLLPGVSRSGESGEVLVVDTRVARWRSLDIFHLFGYRKLRRTGPELTVSRRRFDLSPPPAISRVVP
jgi:succinylglutamate desuccinylase